VKYDRERLFRNFEFYVAQELIIRKISNHNMAKKKIQRQGGKSLQVGCINRQSMKWLKIQSNTQYIYFLKNQ